MVTPRKSFHIDIEENPSFSTPPPYLQVFGDFTLAIKVKRERDYGFGDFWGFEGRERERARSFFGVLIRF